MYLKQLVLKGFKSFADRSVLTLEPGITAVVGPNGSGKSNISDAVLWVLGERNAKNLRGQVMEDVIFAGSSARKSVGMAEVTLVLDNSDGSLPVDYDEVTISRRMYRSGESEYLINNTVVRRLDVLDILHDSGLGTGTHSIIAQGHLDSILQSKPEDRRALIEEAAGVLKHKQRKAKSQRKIEQMDQCLARVNDVVRELDRQLGPLQRKARRAMQYQEAADQLRDVQLQLAVDDLRNLQRQWGDLLEAERQRQADLEAKRAAVAQAEQAYEGIQEGIRRESADVALLAQKQSKASSLVDRFDSLSLLLGEKQRQATQRSAELSQLLDANAAKRATAQEERQKAAADLASVQALRAKAQADLETAQADFDACHTQRLDVEREISNSHRRRSDAEREAERNRQDLAKTQQELASSQGRAQAARERAAEIDRRVAAAQEAFDLACAQDAQAQEAQAQLEEQQAKANQDIAQAKKGQSEATAALSEARKHVQELEAELRGIQEVERAMMAAAGPAHSWVASQRNASWGSMAPLYDALQVQEGYEDLVERMLGSDVTALLVADSSAVRSIGQALDASGKPGRVTLMLPCANAVRRQPAEAGARLMDKISCSQEVRGSVETLLGDVVICPDLAHALEAHEADTQGLRFVTPDAQVVFPSGKVLMGTQAAESGDGALMRAKRQSQVKQLLSQANEGQQKAEQAAKTADEAVLAAQEAGLQISQSLAAARGKAQSAQRDQQSCAQQLKRAQDDRQQSARQEEQAQQAVQQMQPKVEKLTARSAQLEQLVADAKDDVRRRQQQLNPLRDKEQKLSAKLADAKIAAATLTERETYAARSLDSFAKELVSLSSADEAALKDLSSKQAARKRIEPLLDVLVSLREGVQEKAASLAGQVATAQEASLGSHAQANAAREASHGAHAAFDAANDALSQTRIEKGRLELQVQAAADAIVHDCGTPMEQALELPQLQDRAHAQDLAFKLQKRIANMGIINPDAAAEYEQLKERYDYLKAQLDDMASARSALKKIDRVIDERMKDDFINTFHTVNQNFQEVFGILFPGGTAELSLVDPDNLETTGVEVTAQPRGKRITKMTLMSGGEKSLVACALLFAVYRTRSTPFYILDEIEAALDDSNLRRLTSYLRDLSNQTQLIMITHQRRTMEMADVLFGVSMQADGVTKVISQRLDKALQYAE